MTYLGFSSLYFEPDLQIYVSDFSIGLKSKGSEEVPMDRIVKFLVWLRDNFDFKIKMIAGDSFQSSMLFQLLRQEGFDTVVISPDTTRDPYLYLREQVSYNQLLLVKNGLLKKELEELVDDGKKFDHPFNGSKDIADSVVLAVYAGFKYFVQYLDITEKIRESLGVGRKLNGINKKFDKEEEYIEEHTNNGHLVYGDEKSIDILSNSDNKKWNFL